jgi:hypothetical protein
MGYDETPQLSKGSIMDQNENNTDKLNVTDAIVLAPAIIGAGALVKLGYDWAKHGVATYKAKKTTEN